MEKTIQINGTANRYMMKKVMKIQDEVKKRVDSEHWNFLYDDQLTLINNLDESNTDDITKTIIQQINNKLS